MFSPKWNCTSMVVLAAVLVGASLSACRKAESPAAGSVNSSPSPAPTLEAATSAPDASPTTSPTPVKPGEVPEMMRRAMTKEEVDRAFQQLPPEIRDRLKGLSYAPSQAPPNSRPTPTPSKK